MKLSVSSVVLSIFFGSVVVSARPLRLRNGTSNSAGAVYFITNEPSGNMVVSSNIASDGTLTFGNAVSAGGCGLHGNDAPDPTGPDGLFSQGSVKVSQKGQMLAAVNPGSNTIAAFSIDPNNPSSLKMMGAPVCSGGEFPMSLAINQAGTMVCALNGGQVNGVNCYTVGKNGLTAIPNSQRSLGLNQTTPPAGPAGTASHVIFNEAENQLIASVKGTPPTPGFFAAWDVQADGSLSENMTKIAPATGGLLPFSMTVIPGKNAILATDAGVGVDIVDMSAGESNGTSSGSSSILPINGQGATCWSSFSNMTGNFYVTDIKTSMVTEVNVGDNLNATIVKQYPQANNSATIDNDIATVNNKDFMYVLSPNATTINVVSLNAPGQAQGVQNFNFANSAKAAGVTINPNNLQGMTAFIKS